MDEEGLISRLDKVGVSLRGMPLQERIRLIKEHALAHFCADNLADLRCTTRQRLRSMQRRSTRIRAFWKQAELPL